MALRVARPTQYQGGVSFNVFTAQGSNPIGDCKVCGKGIQKLYDKAIKTYVYSLCGKPFSKIQLPKDDKLGLHLLQPFIVFQIFVPEGQPLAFELRISDTSNIGRKMYFSTSFTDMKSTPLHCQIPISMVARDMWLSLSIHVAELFSHCFKGMVFRSIDTIVLGPVCKLRKIFTMRNRLKDFGDISNSVVQSCEDYLPQEHMFALDVNNAIQIVDMAVLKTFIIDIQEDSLKLQKVKMNKLESRQVHVAFGSRIPLPLSTVHINTNLPGDHKLLSHRISCKEESLALIGHIAQMQCETPSISKKNQVDQKKEDKAETLHNLLKHVNTFNKNHAILKLKNNKILLEKGKLSTTDESIERLENVQFVIQDLQLPSNMFTTNDIIHKSKNRNSEVQDSLVQTSTTKDDVSNMVSKDAKSTFNLQWANDNVHSKHMQQSLSLGSEASNVATLETRKNEVIYEEPECKKIIEECKILESKISLGKNTLRCFQSDSDRKKEYKKSKYLDSPPGSPPCGWKNCIKDDVDEKTLKIPSFFNRSCDDIDNIETSKGDMDVGSTIIDDSQLSNPFYASKNGGVSIEDGMKYFNDNLVNFDCTKQSMKGMKKTTLDCDINNIIDEKQRLEGIAHENFEIENDDNCMFQRPKFIEKIFNEDCGFNIKNWSFNDNKDEQCHTSNFFNESSFSPNDHGDVTCDSWKLKDAFVNNGVEDSTLPLTSTLMKNSHNTLQEFETLKNLDKNVNISSSNLFSSFSNKNFNDCDSFEFNKTINFDYNEDLKNILILEESQLKTLHKNMKTPTFEENFLFETNSPSSLDCMDKNRNHFGSFFTFENEKEDLKQVEIFKSEIPHEDEGFIATNGQPNDDLDLLYDPTLDCYYDPKTNRYYELK